MKLLHTYLTALCFYGIVSAATAQVSLLQTTELPYPISRIVHFDHCGDSPLILCRKSNDSYVLMNGAYQFELEKNENLLAADKTHVFTTIYLDNTILLRKYEWKNNTYQKKKEITLPKQKNAISYYLDLEMVEDHLYYFALQPATSSSSRTAEVDFYNQDLDLKFTIKEDLSVYNIHCFGKDSILFLKEYVFDRKLTTHLYDHTGKLKKEESFILEFKPENQSTVNDYLKDDGIIFTLEPNLTNKTHIIKYNHAGKLLWDDVLNEHYYSFTEYQNMLVSYGGGTFMKPDYKLLFVDETKGEAVEEIALTDYYKSFLKEKNLLESEHSYIPFALNVNPEHTWVCFIMSIYATTGKSADADRIIIYHNHQKVQTLDINLENGEHPKVVPTDNNHLMVGIGKKLYTYKIQ